MNDSHRNQTNAAIGKSLTAAGIGRAYHHRNLSELAQGEQLRAWLTTAAKDEVRSGRGWTIIGNGPSAYDTAMLLARGLHLSGLKARVLPLRRLVVQVTEEGELLPELRDCDVLVVLDFYQNYPGVAVPMTGREMQATEAFLNERLDDMRAVFVQQARFTGEATWWSPALLARLAGLNRKLEVA